MSKHPRYHLIAEINHRIAGIPCVIGVLSFYQERGSYSSCAKDPDEYYGCVDADWVVFDRKGYVANWLHNKLTSNDEQEILELITEELLQ